MPHQIIQNIKFNLYLRETHTIKELAAADMTTFSSNVRAFKHAFFSNRETICFQHIYQTAEAYKYVAHFAAKINKLYIISVTEINYLT